MLCHYVLNFRTRHACPPASSWATTILAMCVAPPRAARAPLAPHALARALRSLVVGGLAYLVGGVVYNMRVHDKKGVEAIPNLEFWVQVPALCAEGLKFSSALAKDAFIRLRAMAQGGGGGGEREELLGRSDNPYEAI